MLTHGADGRVLPGGGRTVYISHPEQLQQQWDPAANDNGLLRTNGTLRATGDAHAVEFPDVLQLTTDESHGTHRTSFGLTAAFGYSCLADLPMQNDSLGLLFETSAPGCQPLPSNTACKIGFSRLPKVDAHPDLWGLAPLPPPPPAPPNKFGIGAYDVGAMDAQMKWTLDLAGCGGWITLLLPAANTTSPTNPTDQYNFVSALKSAFAHDLRPLVRLEPLWLPNFDNIKGGLRDLADDAAQAQSPRQLRLNYSSLARQYAKIVNQLPRPPTGEKLHVQVGNELNNGGWGCTCTEAMPCLAFSTATTELAHFMRATAAELRKLSAIAVAHAPNAPLGVGDLSCCPGPAGKPPKHQCGTTPGGSSLEWMVALSRAVPDLFANVDFLASHSYPCMYPGCGQAAGRPDGGWNAPFGAAFNAALPGLTLYRNESMVVGQPHLPVIITETGWCRLSQPSGIETPEELRAFRTVCLLLCCSDVVLFAATAVLQD